ncbi:MAG: integrin alpha [Planctomycetota bacterium]
MFMPPLHRLAMLACSGAAILLPASARAQTRPSAFFNMFGSAAGDQMGTSVRDAGDFNRDGYVDVIVASPGENGGIGAARVFSGKDGSIIKTFLGQSAGDHFGRGVSGVGDVNQDGFDDVLIGAPQDGTGAGYARLFSGFDGSSLYTFTGGAAQDLFGYAVSDIGDVNNDSFGDLVVGAPRDAASALSGYVLILSGKDGSVLHTLNGLHGGDRFGFAVRRAGTVNLDPCADLLIGAPGDANGTGYAQVRSGCDGSVLLSFQGQLAADSFGYAVSGVGDLNGDGFGDVVIGAPGDDTSFADAGSATLFSGKDGTVLATVLGDQAGVALGSSVSEGGHIDPGAGLDFLVGAPASCTSASPGYALALTLVGASVRTIYRADGDAPGDSFGASVSWARDINSDGADDFIVGAPCDDNTGAEAGSARLFSGRVCFASWSNYGNGFAGSNCTPTLTSSGNPVICATVDLDITNCRGQDTQALLIAGLTPGVIPNPQGGDLLVSPPWVFRPMTLPAAGASLPFHVLCDSVFCGLTIYVQAMQFDPGAGGPNQDVSSTPGLALVLGGF